MDRIFGRKRKAVEGQIFGGYYPSPRCEKGHFFLFLKCQTFLLQQFLKAPQRFTLRQPSSVFLNCPRKVPWREIFLRLPILAQMKGLCFEPQTKSVALLVSNRSQFPYYYFLTPEVPPNPVAKIKAKAEIGI